MPSTNPPSPMPSSSPGARGADRVSRTGLLVGVRIVRGVPARDRAPLPVVARRARREVLGGADLQLIAAVRALVRAGGDVAAGGNRICHGGCSSRGWAESPLPRSACPERYGTRVPRKVL